jgi:hypothetical protein
VTCGADPGFASRLSQNSGNDSFKPQQGVR